METKSLYQSLIDAKIKISNHESDLYFERNQESLAILKEYPLHHNNATNFHNQIEGCLWVDVPFAFEPYWKEKQNRFLT